MCTHSRTNHRRVLTVSLTWQKTQPYWTLNIRRKVNAAFCLCVAMLTSRWLETAAPLPAGVCVSKMGGALNSLIQKDQRGVRVDSQVLAGRSAIVSQVGGPVPV